MVNVDEKFEYKAGIKNETEHDIENSIDKMKAGSKAIGEKLGDLQATNSNKLSGGLNRCLSSFFFFSI